MFYCFYYAEKYIDPNKLANVRQDVLKKKKLTDEFQ